MALQLKLDPTGVETGAAQAKAALDGIVPTAAKVESALEQIGKAGTATVIPVAQTAAAIESVGAKSALSYMQIQELGHVTRSVAGVMMAGGSALQAFEFEASRIGTILMSGGGPVNAIKAIGEAITGFLGPVGTEIAVVAGLGAALYELAPHAQTAAEVMKELTDANDRLKSSISGLQSIAAEFANGNLDALRKKYGEVDAQLLILIGHQQQEQIIGAQNAARDAVKALADQYGVAIGQLNLFERTGQGAAAEVAKALGMTKNEFLAFEASIRAAQTAKTLEDQAAALAQVDSYLQRSAANGSDFANNVTDAALQLREVSTQVGATDGLIHSASDGMAALAATQPGAGWLDSAISKAQTLAGALWDGVRAADAASVPALRGPAGMGSPPPSEADIRARSFAVVPTISTGGSGGGSGGGSAIAAGAKVDLQALVDLSKQIDTTGSAWNAFQSSGGNAIDKLISGTGNLKSALRDMIKEMEIALIKGQLLSHVNGASDSMSIGQLLVKGLFSGWHDAGGTIGMGQTGVVGENGPELVTASSSGAMVTSRVDTARMMGGGQQAVHVTVGVSVDDTGALKAYVKNVAQAAGSQAVQTVKRSLSGWSNQLQTDGALA